MCVRPLRELSLDDLADIGQELGLSREAIERAAREVESASAPKSAAELSPVALAGDEALAKHKKRERKKLEKEEQRKKALKAVNEAKKNS